MQDIKVEDREKYIQELRKNPNNYELSEEEGRECYDLPCACLNCRHEQWFCVEDGACGSCGGTLEEITTKFCIPDEDD